MTAAVAAVFVMMAAVVIVQREDGSQAEQEAECGHHDAYSSNQQEVAAEVFDSCH